MKTKLVTLLTCLIFIGTTTIQAQSFGNKLKNKVLNKLENKGNEKIDKAINNAIDKPVDKAEKEVKESVKGNNKNNTKSNSNSNSNTNYNSNGAQTGNPGFSEADMANFMNMMNSEAKVSDFPDQPNVTASPFIGSFDMNIESYKSNGKQTENSTIKWYIDKYDMVMIPESNGSNDLNGGKVVINRKKGLMIVLTGENTGMIMKMSDIADLAANSDFIEEEVDDVKVQVFKNVTQVVGGEKCYKVEVEDDEFKSTAWIAEGFGIRMDQLFGYLGTSNQKGQNKYEDKFGHIKGWAMKSTSVDKKSGEKTVMTTENLKKGSIPAGITSTDGVKLMQMPDLNNMPFMNQGGE